MEFKPHSLRRPIQQILFWLYLLLLPYP